MASDGIPAESELQKDIFTGKKYFHKMKSLVKTSMVPNADWYISPDLKQWENLLD